jgi:hypothetical protein
MKACAVKKTVKPADVLKRVGRPIPESLSGTIRARVLIDVLRLVF